MPSLRHLHLTNLTLIPTAAKIQDSLVRHHLNHKASQSAVTTPQPTLITFTPPPTYTTGRRDINTLTPTQIASLRGLGPSAAAAAPLPASAAGAPAYFHAAPRGGQTTFHGPGQLVAYLICDLRTHGLTPRTHIRLLELSVVEAVARIWPLLGRAYTSSCHPGVWIDGDGDDGDGGRKLASVGVWLRRNVSAFGVAVNVSTDLAWFRRIVACGLSGWRVTSVEAEVGRMGGLMGRGGGEVMELGVELARVLARELDGVDEEVVMRVAGATDLGEEVWR